MVKTETKKAEESKPVVTKAPVKVTKEAKKAEEKVIPTPQP